MILALRGRSLIILVHLNLLVGVVVMLKGALAALVLRALVGLLRVASLAVSEASLASREEVSAYECGFEHSNQSRLPFSLRYFLLTIIFLVFDMEIVFLLFLPELHSANLVSHSVLAVSLIFVILLILGLVYEWKDGSLDWVI